MGYYLRVGVHLHISRRDKDVGKAKLVVAATIFLGKGVVIIQYSETLQVRIRREYPKEIPKSCSHSQRGDKAEMEEERAYICQAMSCKVKKRMVCHNPKGCI